MRTTPAGVDDRAVADAVSQGWGLRTSRMRYVPLGGGSYHWAITAADGAEYFLTLDDLHDKPWLGADADTAFRGLRSCYGTARALRHQARLAFVCAPLASADGEPARRVSPRYSLAVFPFVPDLTGQWGDDLTAQARNRIIGLLADLHRSTSVADGLAPLRSAEVYERDVLDAALRELDEPWTAGPLAEPARQALAGRADAVTASLASFDRLAAHQAQSNGGLVITHGEPHGGNLMHTGGRLVLIDWDTVALAPPERDLWMLDDGTDGALAAYTEATGRIVDPMAISYYRLAWMLADLASFTGLLRAEHQRDADTEHAWRALRSYLYPDSTELTGPYRHVLEPQRQPG